MHLLKPRQVALCTRAIEHRGRFGLCITQMLMASMSGKPALFHEQTLWNFVASQPVPPLLDEGVAKLTPEFLVHGHAYPSNEQRNASGVRVRLGPVEKKLIAFGERYWDGGKPTVPAPFEKIALGWDRAYGGGDFAGNPTGMGRDAREGVLWLPQFEAPSDRLLEKGQAVRPAGLSPIDPMHPQRAALRGTYDETYLKLHSPGFPPDIDWRYFNMAPPDQWLDAPLKGDEPFELDHLHPTKPRLQGRLPGLRARVFVDYRLPGGGHKLKEVPTRLTTVWFFPEAEQLVLVFHGLAEVSEHDADDVARMMCAVEDIAHPRSDAHYAHAMERRLDPAWGAVAALDDSDLLPDGLDLDDPEAAKATAPFGMDGLQAEAQRRRAGIEMALAREKARELGRDPDAMGLAMPPREAPPTIAQLPAYLEAMHKEMEKQQCAAAEQMAEHLLKAMEHARAHKVDLASMVHRGPPAYRAETELAALRAQFEGHENFDAPAIEPRLRQKEMAQRLGYLQSAHLQPPVDRQPPEAAARTRKELEWMLAKGLRILGGIDLTGADLSGMDLHGVDFSGGWLESANLRGTNLSGANLAGCVLAHADMSGCIAVEANFVRANLGRAKLDDAVLDRCDLSAATLSHAALVRTHLRRATLQGTYLFETSWSDVDGTELQAPGQLFYKLDLKGLAMPGAALAGATFVECDLSGAQMQAAQLQGASFVSCRLDGARMNGVQAQGLTVTETPGQPASLRSVEFAHANLSRANLGGCNLEGARMAQAVLDGANVGMANLQAADLRGASAQGALLRKTSLKDARMEGINLKEAVLSYADLRSADMRQANLYGADLSRVRLDGRVRLGEALTDRARTWPRLTPEQQALADGAPEGGA